MFIPENTTEAAAALHNSGANETAIVSIILYYVRAPSTRIFVENRTIIIIIIIIIYVTTSLYRAL